MEGKGKQSAWFLAYTPDEHLLRIRSTLKERRPEWPTPPIPPTKGEWRARLGGESGTTEAPDGSTVAIDLAPFADLPDGAHLFITCITVTGEGPHPQDVLDALLERRRRPDLHLLA